MTEVIIFCHRFIRHHQSTGTAAALPGLSQRLYPTEVRRRMGGAHHPGHWQSFLLIIVWFGAAILTGLQIEIGSMQIAGGVIMFRAALAMLEPEDKQLKKDEQEQLESAAWSCPGRGAPWPFLSPLAAAQWLTSLPPPWDWISRAW